MHHFQLLGDHLHSFLLAVNNRTLRVKTEGTVYDMLFDEVQGRENLRLFQQVIRDLQTAHRANLYEQGQSFSPRFESDFEGLLTTINRALAETSVTREDLDLILHGILGVARVARKALKTSRLSIEPDGIQGFEEGDERQDFRTETSPGS